MISILMPVYNGVEYINDSIKSVDFQTFTEWELIIGVNGHPKSSGVYQTATKYSSDKISVRDFPELRGKSVTLNKLLILAKYDIICLIDVDDIWAPEKLMSQMPYIDKYDIVGTNCQYFGESEISPPLCMGDIGISQFSWANSIINSSSMINRRGRGIYWDSSWDGVEDYDLWIRLAREGWTFFNINTVLVKHRIHKDSFFNTKNRELSETLRKSRFNV